MCVAQYRNYVKAFSFKHIDSIKKNDEIDHSRGTFYGSGRAWYYVKDKTKMEQLKKQKNPYALKEGGE